jgi:gliding motility-associated transport system permease protein
MRGFILLLRRELSSSFNSFGFWLILSAVTGFTAWVFRTSLMGSYGDLDRALASSFGWLFFLTAVVAPLLTMRLIAEERASGSLELLMTAPVSDAQVVSAKYVSALIVYAIYLLPIWIIHAILAGLFEAAPDWGQLAAMSLGLLSLGMVFLAVGLFASAASSSQIWAALLAVMGIAALWGTGLAHGLAEPGTRLAKILSATSLYLHVGTAASGIVDLRHLVFAATLTLLLLFWTIRLLESRKWA